MGSQTWSIVLFCYNEEKTIAPVYQATLNLLKEKVTVGFEIIVVDDGSTDHSVNEIHKLQHQFPSHTKVVLHPKNIGIGRALRSGYTNAQFENVCCIPADGQFDVNELIPFLNFDSDTFISFYRVENLQYTSFRNVLSFFNKKINSFFLSIRLKDVNWVKVYKRREIKSFEWKLNSSLLESELCAKLLAKGNKVIEVESVFHPRQAGVSKGASFKIFNMALKETLLLILVMFIFKRKLK